MKIGDKVYYTKVGIFGIINGVYDNKCSIISKCFFTGVSRNNRIIIDIPLDRVVKADEYIDKHISILERHLKVLKDFKNYKGE